MPQEPVFIDDGRRRTLLGRLGHWLLGSGAPAPSVLAPPPVGEEPEPAVAEFPEHLEEHQVLLPDACKLPGGASEQFLLAARFCEYPVAWELLGLPSGVSVQFAAASEDAGHLRAQIRSIAPEAAVIPRPDFLAETWMAAVKPQGLVVDLGLVHHFTRPLRSGRALPADPYVSLAAALSGVADGELAVLQVVFEPAVRAWAEGIIASTHDVEGRSLLPADLAGPLRMKFETPLFAARVRIGVKAETEPRRLQLLRSIMGGIAQLSDPRGNELLALDNRDWDYRAQIIDLFARTGHRAGMILNTQELSALVHLPGPELRVEKFERISRRTKIAPAALCEGVVLGENHHQGQTRMVRLPEAHRARHIMVSGGTGSGKSTLLLNLITQDIAAGRGVGVLDPHGDLIEHVLARIPPERVGDVVLVDPADEEFPVGLNVLSAHTELERTLLSSDLVAVFRKMSTSWGDQLHNILAQAIIAFLESSSGGTLLDLRRFLVDREFRTSFLQTVADPEVRLFWEKEFPLLRSNSQAPILTRLNSFLRPRIIRNMVGVRDKTLDFRAVLDERRILLGKLSHGAIGEENAHLLGSLIVAKLQQAALSRQDIEAHERAPFSLYLDEFQHFATPSLASMLSGVRKYGMSVTLASQSLAQTGPDILDSVLTNAGTRIVFHVHEQDARTLASGFSFFEPRDIGSLGIGEAIVRVGRATDDFNLRTFEASPVLSDVAARVAEIRERSRERFGTPRESVVVPTVPLPPPEPLPPPATVVPVASAPKKVAVPRVAADPSPGRGGQKHKYLQSLIASLGQERGFRASIEETVLSGAGSVDVALIRGDLRIAVEITVTTPTSHELSNIQKCLAAGFAHVLLVAADIKSVRRIQRALPQAISPDEMERVRVLAPEDVPAVLDCLALPAETTATIAGYRVSVAYKPSEAAPGARKAIGEIIGRSLKRTKNP